MVALAPRPACRAPAFSLHVRVRAPAAFSGAPAPLARALALVVARGCQTVAGVPMEWRASAACPATLHSAAPLRAAAACARGAGGGGGRRAARADVPERRPAAAARAPRVRADAARPRAHLHATCAA